MKVKTRFINSVIETAKKSDTEMPWHRGTHRAMFVASRRTEKPAPRSLRTA